jgi:hypothetical protein
MTDDDKAYWIPDWDLSRRHVWDEGSQKWLPDPENAPTPKQEHMDLIKDLRDLVLSYNGPIEDSPHYMQLARLLVSEAILGNYPR